MIKADFATLDDLCLAAQLNPDRLRTLNGPVFTTTLGVAAELELFRSKYLPHGLDQVVEVNFSRLRPLIQQWREGRLSSLSSSLSGMGFIRIAEAIDKEEVEWTKFGLYAQRCAAECGVPKITAAQLVSALGELRSNVLEHSQHHEAGIAAFLTHADGIEMLVADSGIGLLDSLKQSSAFSNLRDHGSALRTALSDGASRFGVGVGRGFGFRPIFLGLANAVGELRFRTGDHALSISGESPSLIRAKIAQKAHFQGFLSYIRWRSSHVSVLQS